MLSALIPMPVDSGLNGREVVLSDGSFSDGKGQHFNCIAERTRGRQQKMHGNEKILITEDSAGNWSGLWVEMKNRGLIFIGITDLWTY